MADVNEPRPAREEEVAGAKGGAAAAPWMVQPPAAAPGAAYPYAGAPYAESTVLMRDRIRWSAIWAGLVIALVTQLILNALGVAVGLTAFRAATPTTALPTSLDIASAVWVGVASLIALFLGGYVAARMSGLLGPGVGMLHGVIVWALTLLAGTLLVVLGVSGTLGFIGGNLRLILDAMTGRALGASPGVGAPTANAIVSYAASASWWFIITAVVGLIVAALGGLAGIRRTEEAPVAP